MPAPVKLDLASLGGAWPVISITGGTGAGTVVNLEFTILPELLNSGNQWANGTKTITRHTNGDWLVKSGATVLYRKIGSKPWPWTSGAWTGENSATGTLALARKNAVPNRSADLDETAVPSGDPPGRVAGLDVVGNFLQTNLGNVQNDLRFVQIVEGEAPTIRYTAIEAPSDPIAVLVVSRAIEIRLPTSSGICYRTGNEIITAVQASSPASALVSVSAVNEGGGGGGGSGEIGSGFVFGPTALSGGVTAPPGRVQGLDAARPSISVTGSLTNGTNPVTFPAMPYLEQVPAGRAFHSTENEDYSVGWVTDRYRLVVVTPLEAVWESTADVASPHLVPAGAWHATTNPTGWKPVAPATGTPVLALVDSTAPPVRVTL